MMENMSALLGKGAKRLDESLKKHSKLYDQLTAVSNEYGTPPPVNLQNKPQPQPQHPPPSPLYAQPPSASLYDSETANVISSHPPRPIQVAGAELVGEVKAVRTRVVRDLGFAGKLGDHVLLTYGDTMFKDQNWSDRFIGMTSNSVGIATGNPLVVHDTLLDGNGYPLQFLPVKGEWGENTTDDAVGITNVVELGPGRGIIYFLLNHRPGGKQTMVGAGVADVWLTYNDKGEPVPQSNRICKYWWDGANEPHYGDVCALRFKGHIYCYGGYDNPWKYLARVPVAQAFELQAYEYWNGTGWQKERLHGPSLGEKESVFWKITQGQIFWSDFHNCLLFIYCDAWWSDQVLVATATAPEGPWSKPITIWKAQRASPKGCIYSPGVQTHLDESGRTVTLTYTNMPALIEAVKVTFT